MARFCQRKICIGTSIAFMAIATILFFTRTPAYSSQQIASLTDFAGTVVIQSRGDWGVKPEKGFPLYSMDKVVTRTGTAKVTFNDGAVVEIKANTNLLIEEQEKTEGVTRNLRLLLGKVSFKTGIGSRTRTNLQTPTSVAGLRGTAGILSIGIDGKSYIQFSEGGTSYTVGDFISGVAKDVPPELADLNPAQRAAFVASAAADQAKNAAEAAKDGKAPEAQAALASAKAAEAAAVEAKTAAQAMINNPASEIVQQAQTAIQAADKAIEAAKQAEQKALDAGATPPAPGTYTPPSDNTTTTPGFDVEPPASTPPPTIPPTFPPTTTPPTTETPVTTSAAAPTTSVVGMSSRPAEGILGEGSSLSMAGTLYADSNTGPLYVSGGFTPPISSPTGGPVGGTMTDGSAFEGYLGGVAGSWSGSFQSIFTSPSGDAGFLYSNLTGTAVDGQLIASGNLSRTSSYGKIPAGQTLSSLLAQEDYFQYVGLPFLSSISVDSSGRATNLGTAEPLSPRMGIELGNGTILGVWRHDLLDGVYSNDFQQTSWSGMFGYAGPSYFLGQLQGTDDLAGHVSIRTSPDGMDYLDEDYRGKIFLEYRGYNPAESGDLLASASGRVVLEPLAWGGYTWGSLKYFDSWWDELASGGNASGLVGGITPSLFTGGPSPALMIGSFDDSLLEPYTPALLYGSGWYFSGGSKTGPERYNGYIVGTWTEGAIAAEVMSLYIDSMGKAGYISGSPSGSYHTLGDQKMWRMEGLLTSHQKGDTSVNPADLDSSLIRDTFMLNQVGRGGFYLGETKIIGPDITVDTAAGDPLRILDQNWGIWNAGFGGTYDPVEAFDYWKADVGGAYWGEADGNGYWLGLIQGAQWGANGLRGSYSGTALTGQALYNFQGTVLGSPWEGDGGFWHAAGIGIYDRTPLLFSSALSGPMARLVEGVYLSSEFERGAGYGPFDEYEYEFFLSNDQRLLFGSKELDPLNQPSSGEIYFPDGKYITFTDLPWGITSRDGTWTVGQKSMTDFTTLPDPQEWRRRWFEAWPSNLLAQSGTLSGVLGGTATLWGEGAAPFDILAMYQPSAGDSLFNLWLESSPITTGAYRGYLAGVIKDPSTQGLFYGIYVDPSRKAGILKGGFDGTTYPGIGMLEASGSMLKTYKGDVAFDPAMLSSNMDPPGILVGWLAGGFGDPGSFIYSDGGHGWSQSIKGQDWGVYQTNMSSGNFFYDPMGSGSWSAVAGGMGEFGTRPYGQPDNRIPDPGIWLAHDLSGTASAGILQTSLPYTGKFLTYSKYGDIHGEIVGTYGNPSMSWQATSAGSWEKTQPLRFLGVVGDSNIRMEVKAWDGNYADGSSYYNYSYLETVNQGWSKEYNAPLQKTTAVNYRNSGTKETWFEDGGLGYLSQSWTASGTILNAMRTGSSLLNPVEASGPNYRMHRFGRIDGLIGGLEDPWSGTFENPADIVVIGEYDRQYEHPDVGSVFDFTFSSYNPYLNNRTIWNQADNSEYGAFRGFAGGTISPDLMSGFDDIGGGLLGIYLDNQGNMGVLKGDFAGTGYPEVEMWEAAGGVYPVQLAQGTGMLPANFFANTQLTSGSYVPPRTSGADPESTWWSVHPDQSDPLVMGRPGDLGGFSADGSSGAIELKAREWKSLSVNGQHWGIAQTVSGGIYSGTPTDEWARKSDFIEGSTRKITQVDGTKWSAIDNKIEASISGAWANLDAAITGVIGGDLKGTFNPNTYTWQTVSRLTSIDTDTFLNLVDMNRTALEKLNIPCIEVGRASLVQADGTTVNNLSNVAMNNVKFFRYSTGTAPRIWATNEVGGKYTGTPAAGGPAVPLAGNGLTANFAVSQWGAGKWAANVSGGGTYVGTGTMNGSQIQMKGAAAGQIDPAGQLPGTFGGTGAGVVKTVP